MTSTFAGKSATAKMKGIHAIQQVKLNLYLCRFWKGGFCVNDICLFKMPFLFQVSDSFEGETCNAWLEYPVEILQSIFLSILELSLFQPPSVFIWEKKAIHRGRSQLAETCENMAFCLRCRKACLLWKRQDQFRENSSVNCGRLTESWVVKSLEEQHLTSSCVE